MAGDGPQSFYWHSWPMWTEAEFEKEFGSDEDAELQTETEATDA